MGGLIGLLQSFTRRTFREAKAPEVKYDPGAGKLKAAPHFASAGDDAHPLPGDYVFAVPFTQSGMTVVVGYIDPVNAGVAAAGEKRLYARDGDGAPMCEVWLKADGTVTAGNDAVQFELGADGSSTLANAGGAVELGADGTVTINGVTIDPAGNISTPGEIDGLQVTATSINAKLGTHTHSSGGSGPPIPGT